MSRNVTDSFSLSHKSAIWNGNCSVISLRNQHFIIIIPSRWTWKSKNCWIRVVHPPPFRIYREFRLKFRLKWTSNRSKTRKSSASDSVSNQFFEILHHRSPSSFCFRFDSAGQCTSWTAGGSKDQGHDVTQQPRVK